VIRVDYPPRPDQARVQSLIREVIAAHPQDYAPPGDWQANAVYALQKLAPENQRGMLDVLFAGSKGTQDGSATGAAEGERWLGEL